MRASSSRIAASAAAPSLRLLARDVDAGSERGGAEGGGAFVTSGLREGERGIAIIHDRPAYRNPAAIPGRAAAATSAAARADAARSTIARHPLVEQGEIVPCWRSIESENGC